MKEGELIKRIHALKWYNPEAYAGKNSDWMCLEGDWLMKKGDYYKLFEIIEEMKQEAWDEHVWSGDCCKTMERFFKWFERWFGERGTLLRIPDPPTTDEKGKRRIVKENENNE